MSNISSNILRILENSYLNPTDKALMRCEVAKELETAGDYEGARDALGELWRGVGQRPVLDGLDEKARAFLLLRAGSLTGWLGSSEQIAGSQEAAKDLISESIRELETLGMTSKVAEAQSEMALCYWREGSFDEARVILGGARERLDEIGEESKYDQLKALILIRSAIVEFKAKRFEEALQFLRRAEPLAEAGDNDVIKGKLHVELALTLRNLASGVRREEYLDLALVEYAAASFFFEQAGHVRYSARVENNLGYLLFTLGRFAEAHEHLDHAERLFLRLKDKGSVAQVKETRAQVYLADGKPADAERAARSAVEVLKEGNEHAFLSEAQTTLGVALARLDRAEEARGMLETAMSLVEMAGDAEGAGKIALTLIEELSGQLSTTETCSLYRRADRLLTATDYEETVRRLRLCARVVISKVNESFRGEAQPAPKAVEKEGSMEDETNLPLPEAVRRYEARLIAQALGESGGSVTKAAQRLGVGHQTLSAILHQRHQELLTMKKPRKRRQMSIIVKGSK
jgi:tetratricopeptide (TPR) repeat protein